MPRQIAAVHGGDVERLKGFEGLGVIPVVEMTPEPFEFFHGAEGTIGFVQKGPLGNKAEIRGREVRKKREPHIRGRSAVRHEQDGVLLVIIGGKPVILRADKGLEEHPRPPGDLPEEDELFLAQARRGATEGLAEPPAYPR